MSCSEPRHASSGSLVDRECQRHGDIVFLRLDTYVSHDVFRDRHALGQGLALFGA